MQGSKTDTLVPSLDKENTDLTIEAIKLVELLSSLNIEDFQQNQWIFLIDGYGMKLEKDVDGQSQSSSPQKAASASKKLQEEQEKQARMKVASVQDQEMFKTFIVRFIGDQSFSFYNVDKPQEGTDQEVLDSYFLDQQRMRNVDGLESGDAMSSTAVPKGSDQVSASPQSSSNSGSASGDPFIEGGAGRAVQAGQNPQSQRASRDPLPTTQHTQGDGDFTFVVSKDGEFDSRLTQQACSLQQSINDQNVTGSEFNRQEAEAKIELDFLSNDGILKL